VEPARVEIDLGFFPLMWILYFVSPWLAIDGHAQQRSWGKHQMMIPAGQHVFEAWFPYIFRSRTCPALLGVVLQPGAAYRLRYRPAWLMFLSGSMKIVEQPTLPAATARQLPPAS